MATDGRVPDRQGRVGGFQPIASSNPSAPSSASSFGLDVDAFLAPDFDVKEWINDALAVPAAALRARRQNNAEGNRESEEDSEPFAAGEEKAEDTLEASGMGVGEGAKERTSISTKPSQASAVVPSSSMSVEQCASNLVLKLQLLSLDISTKFEQLSEEAVRNIPRTLYDLDLIRKDAQRVREAIDDARRGFDQAERGAGGAFKDLVRLDQVRNRMASTRLALKEAENWSTLSGEMDAIFSARDYTKASIRLEEAQRSLVLLAATPDYEERRDLLANLQNQLETSLSPQLTAALNDHDAEAVRKLYNVYNRIQRSDEFTKLYNKSRISALVRFWQQYDEELTIRVAASGGDQEFGHWLNQFYDEILMVLKKELSWCAYIFPNPQKVLHDLVQEVFEALQPAAASRIRGLASRLKDSCLPSIVNAYQATVQFGVKVEKLLFFSNVTKEASSPTRSENSKERSSVDSHRSDVSAPPHDDLSNWGNIVFEPFVAFQQGYDKHERNYLLFASSTILALDKKTDYMELARVMTESVAKLFSFAEASVGRCRLFTTGFGAGGLVDALNDYFAAVFDRYGNLVQQLRGDVGLDRGALQHTSTELDDDDVYNFGSGELGRQEWGNFQVGLRLLGLCSAINKRLMGFDRVLRNALGGIVRRRLDVGWDTPMDFWVDEKEHVEECWASFRLLSMSTLNSYKLRNVLSAFEAIADGASTQAMRDNSIEGEPRLFERALGHLNTLTAKFQRFVFDTLFAVVEKQLAPLPSMDTWNSNAPTTAGPFNLDVPQFSLSPLSYITRIGEHLLTLPQQLELYVDDDALKFSIKTLPYLTPKDFEHNEEEIQPEEDDVTHLWITSVSRGTMSTYINSLLRIPRLSQHGTKQILTDVGYIANVFAAMDIELLPEFRRVHALLDMDNAEVKARFLRVKQGKPEVEGDGFIFGDEDLVRRVTGIRGIDVGRYP
ncbi:hypothetical protein SpCBS45565_g01108 [Spizellomyces sp. 'palustris']|nr:hypothetical protein SpCBS45565_g01108 [Spizellomyces sp. 'palustris']